MRKHPINEFQTFNRPTISSSKHQSSWIQLHPIVPALRFVGGSCVIRDIQKSQGVQRPSCLRLQTNFKLIHHWLCYRDSWDRTLTTHRWKERRSKHVFDMNRSPMVWCTMILTLCGSDDFEQKLTPSRTPTRNGPRYSIMEQENLPICHDNLNSHSMVFAWTCTRKHTKVVEWAWTPGVYYIRLYTDYTKNIHCMHIYIYEYHWSIIDTVLW